RQRNFQWLSAFEVIANRRPRSMRVERSSPKTLDAQLGARIRDLRSELKITEEEFAAKLRINARSVLLYETGQLWISSEMLLAFADALGRSVEELLALPD